MPIHFSESVLNRACCPLHDRMMLVPIINTFCEYARQFRREEDVCVKDQLDLSKDNRNLLHTLGLRLFLHGYSQHELSTVLMNIVHTSQHSGKELLARLLIAEGFDCLAQKKTSKSTRYHMHSLLGEELCDPAAVHSLKGHPTEGTQSDRLQSMVVDRDSSPIRVEIRRTFSFQEVSKWKEGDILFFSDGQKNDVSMYQDREKIATARLDQELFFQDALLAITNFRSQM